MENKKKTLYTTTGVVAGVILATAVGTFAASGDSLSSTVTSMKGKMQSEVLLDYASQPQILKDYVNTNYADMTVSMTKQDDGGVEVKLDNGTDLIFENDGTFREVETHSGKGKHGRGDHSEELLDFSTLPETLQNYVSMNYSQLSVVKSEEEDGKIEVKLSDGTELIFNLDGSFNSTGDEVNEKHGLSEQDEIDDEEAEISDVIK